MAPQYTVDSLPVKLPLLLVSEVWPAECLACGAEGSWVCESCTKQSIRIKAHSCPFCPRLSPNGKTCPRCARNYNLSGCLSAWHYSHAVVDIIHTYKYQGITASLPYLCDMLIDASNALPFSLNDCIVTYVPSTAKRMEERGFNQSESLAKTFARQNNVTFAPALKRIETKQSQTKLGRRERFANTANQFCSLPNVNIIGKTVILIDDVITTGATVNACAQALKGAGVKRVWGLTLAKD